MGNGLMVINVGFIFILPFFRLAFLEASCTHVKPSCGWKLESLVRTHLELACYSHILFNLR